MHVWRHARFDEREINGHMSRAVRGDGFIILTLGTCWGGSGAPGTQDVRCVATDERVMKASLIQQKDLLMMLEAHWMYVENEVWMRMDVRKAQT